jgi:hypothetical protein
MILLTRAGTREASLQAVRGTMTVVVVLLQRLRSRHHRVAAAGSATIAELLAASLLYLRRHFSSFDAKEMPYAIQC